MFLTAFGTHPTLRATSREHSERMGGSCFSLTKKPPAWWHKGLLDQSETTDYFQEFDILKVSKTLMHPDFDIQANVRMAARKWLAVNELPANRASTENTFVQLCEVVFWQECDDLTERQPVKPLSAAQRVRFLAEISKRDGWLCAYCEVRLTPATATLDHVMARKEGGPHDAANLVLSCGPCNSSKGAKSLAEWKR